MFQIIQKEKNNWKLLIVSYKHYVKLNSIKKIYLLKDLDHKWQDILESFSKHRVYEKLEKTTSSVMQYLKDNSSDCYLQFHDLDAQILTSRSQNSRRA